MTDRLIVRELTKKYGDLTAVNKISFEIKVGEIFGFLGPNGAGKTTTMKMITGLLQPTSGKITIDDIDIIEEPLKAKSLIGYIPDRPYIYEKLTAREFLLFIAGLYSIPEKVSKNKADELLQLFDLTSVADELIENFSHGMKQRLTMAAALIHSPHLIVVDEPMVGLDPRGSLLIRRLFKKLSREDKVSIFLSTHTLSIAEEVCDRLAIINRGELIAIGTLDELRELAASKDATLEELFLKLTSPELAEKEIQEV